MPIPEWIFANHWALLDGSRQWEAQTWRSTGIDWTTSSEVIDAFGWELGNKIYKAILGINKNPQPEDCQHVRLVFRDIWIKFSHMILSLICEMETPPGRSDVKTVIDYLGISEPVRQSAQKALDSTQGSNTIGMLPGWTQKTAFQTRPKLCLIF